MRGRNRKLLCVGLSLALGLSTPTPIWAQAARDWVTGLPRQAVHVPVWPGRKKVAVCFVLYVEVWGHGHGPNFRSDMAGRDPDVVDEGFRQYGIIWGVPRVGQLFHDEGVPLSIALNAQFPAQHPDVWKRFRALVPNASIIAHGMNNSTELLPLGQGPDAQKVYIRRTLAMIKQDTGVQSTGWSSPSVYPNGDTFTATAEAGITYTLDGMDSDTLSRLITRAGPLLMIPYPAVTVDMGQYLSRNKDPQDLEHFWIDYVTDLAREAAADPTRDASVVAIGLHPFVVGTPAGAAALRRVIETLKKQDLVWITNTEAVVHAVEAVPAQ
jgi:peptidoglycan/xylan/chitin deacetylase (PgdA/CDA1 family)